MSDWRDKEAIHETVFREMNEWTEEGTDAVLGSGDRIDAYLCECSDRGCTEPIRLTRLEYEAIRVEPLRFAVALNHENPGSTGSSRRTSGSLRSSSMAVPAGSLARQTPVVSEPFRPSSSSRVNPSPFARGGVVGTPRRERIESCALVPPSLSVLAV